MRTTAFLAAICVALGACSTPAARIKKDPDRFNSYPPQAQNEIRAGKVDVGFTQEMTRMALGAPDRVYRRTTAQGDSVVWAYTQRGIETGSVYLDPGQNAGGVPQGTIVTQPAEERLRVVFEDGKAVSIERREK